MSARHVTKNVLLASEFLQCPLYPSPEPMVVATLPELLLLEATQPPEGLMIATVMYGPKLQLARDCQSSLQ